MEAHEAVHQAAALGSVETTSVGACILTRALFRTPVVAKEVWQAIASGDFQMRVFLTLALA